MLRVSTTTKRKDAKRELEEKLRDLQSDNLTLNEAVNYASSDKLSFDNKKRNSLYDSASKQADRLNTLSALLRSNRDIYEAEYGKDYVDNLVTYANRGGDYLDIATSIKNKNNIASQFKDESDYNNWQQYGKMDRDNLKSTAENLTKDYNAAKKSGNTSTMETTRNSLAWINNRLKSPTFVNNMSIEDMQVEKSKAKKTNSVYGDKIAELKKQKVDAETLLQQKLDNYTYDVQNGTYNASEVENLQNKVIPELDKKIKEYENLQNGDVAYFDQDGNAISWDKAINDKIRNSYSTMTLEEIEAKRKEAATNLEKSKTSFLGIPLPSGETTSLQGNYDAWESAYQVKKAEENKKNPDWVEKSKMPDVTNEPAGIQDTIKLLNGQEPEYDKRTVDGFWGEGFSDKVKQMTPDQVAASNYIYNTTKDIMQVRAYIDGISSELNKKVYDEAVARESNLNGGGLAWENVKSVAENTFGAIPAAVNTVASHLMGQPIDPYDPAYKSINSADITRAETSRRIQDNIGGVGGDVVDFLYGTAMSGLDSAATLPINMVIPGSGLLIMGSRAGVSATNDAIKKGVSQDKAMLTGLLAGGFEAAFEKIPLDRLTDIIKNGKNATEGMFKTLLKEGGINASEEFLTTASTEMADRIINADLSNYAVNIERYKMQGLTQEEATAKANTDFALQLAEDAASGFLQGFAMTAGGNAVNTAYNKSVGGNVAENKNVSALVEKAKEIKGSEELNALISEVEKYDAEKLTGKQKANVGKLYNLALNEAQQQLTDGTASKNKIKSAIVSRLTELKSQNIGATADAIVKNINGEKLSKEESNTISNNPVAQRVISEIENAGSQDYTSDWASDAIADTMSERSTGVKAFQEIQNLANATSENVATGQQKAKASGIAVNPQNIDTYTEGDKVVNSAVNALKTAQNGNILVEFEDGNTKALSDVSLSEDAAEVVAYAKDYGAYADVFLQTYKQGTTESVDEFAKEFNYAYEIGKIGGTLDYVKNSEYTKSLTPTQIQNAWEVGRQMSEAEARSGSVATYEEYHANKKAGKVTVDKSISTKRLNHNQISAMYAVRGIARATGINIVLENKGLVRDTNGAYDPNTNTIHIDINAGKYGLNFGEYAMLRTLSHELTHYIKENNKAAYKQLQDFIFSKLSDYKGKSIDELVAAEQYEGMSFEDAAEEVVARACETMLRDSVAIEALYNENRGLFNTIKNFIANFKKAVYRAFDRVGARSEAAKAMLGYADELQTLWDNALVGAVHNQQGKGNVQGTSRNVKHERNSLGEELSKEQSEYFKDSKVRDENGNLLVMYHGTPNAGFTVFRRGTYFTAIKGYADVYQNQGASSLGYKKTADNPDTYAVYLNIKKPFDTREKAARDIFYNEYYRQWGTGTELTERGLPDWTDGEDLLEFLEEQGYDYDGIVLDEGGTGGFGEEVRSRGISYVAFSPEQVKNIDNLNPTDNPDIRYERAEITEDEVISQSKKAMAAELTRLRELLKMQGRESHGTMFTKSSVDLVAAELIEKADSRLTKAELAPLLNKLYARIASDKELNFEDVMDEARGIADKINEDVRQRKFQDPYKKEIRDYLRKNRILITEEALAEGRFHYGGAKEFYNAWRGKLKFTTTDKSALPIDTLWQEAQGLYGDYFDSNVTIESEMAYKLVEIYNQLNEDVTADFSDYYSDEIREQTAYDIYDGFWRVNTLHTVADKYAKEMRQLKSVHKTRLEKLRAESEQTIKDLKSANREKIKSVYEKRDREREIRSISKRAKLLYDKLMDNSAKKHIPEPLKQPLGNFLMSLDFSSKSMLDNAALTQADAKFSERLSALNMKLKDYAGYSEKGIKTGASLDIRAELTEELDKLYESITKKFPSGTFTINKMSLNELIALRKCITEISKAINEADRTLSGITTQRISELGNETIDDLDGIDTYQPFSNKHLKGASNFVKWDLKIPYYAFKMFGGGGKTIFKGLMNGWGNFSRNIKAITDFAEKAYTEKEVKKWQSNIQTYNLSGGSLKMTDSIAMYLYVAVRREQARRHLFGAGLAIEEFEQKGKVRNVAQKGQHFSVSDIAEIEKHLTERQKQVANELQKFMSEDCAEWGNAVSMKRFGIKIFTEKNYVPIKTLEGGDAVSDNDADRSLYRLLNFSFTKATTVKANNSLVARDIFDVFTEHTTDMAKYNALALPMLDAIRWANFQETVNDEEVEVKSVKKALDNAYGTDAMSYINTFFKALSGVKDGGTSRVEGLAKGMLKKFKIAAVAGNLRVAMLQLTSYFRAGAVLSQKSLAFANVKKIASNDLVNKYCGMALWKSMGYFDINVSRGVREKISKKSSVTDKIVEKSLWLTGKADEYTLRKLWVACEYEISKSNPKLKKGSEEYNRAVGEKLDEVIFATQVVDSTITRAPIMREKSATVQQLSAFMSEPLLTLNVMTDGYVEMHNDIHKGMSKPKAIAKHFPRLMKLSGIYFSQALIVSLFESIWDAWRDDDDDEFIDKFLKSVPNNIYENINPANQAPLLNDALELFENKVVLPLADKMGKKETAELIVGKDYSQNSKSEFVQFFYDITDAYKKWGKIIKGESDNYYGAIYKTSVALSRTAGIPLSNVMREGVSLYNNIVDFAGRDDLKLLTYEPSTADKWDSFERNFENKDTTKMKKVVDDMLNEKTEKYISEGATKQEAKAKALTSVRSSFTRRYKKLYQEAYKSKDTEECARIYRLAQSSKLYPNTQATISGWKQTD